MNFEWTIFMNFFILTILFRYKKASNVSDRFIKNVGRIKVLTKLRKEIAKIFIYFNLKSQDTVF